MCYKYKDPEDMSAAEQEFDARFSQPEYFTPPTERNGFEHPHVPVILDKEAGQIVTAYWGLVPAWAARKDRKEFFKTSNTLNAKIEEAAEKASYKNSIDNRCLVLADYFIEYKHVPVPGMKKVDKIPYKIYGPGRRPFAMAGLYSLIGDEPTFTILTTEANTLMAEIHNSAKRMPVVLRPEEVQLWLHTDQREKDMRVFHSRHEVELEAIPLHGGTPPIPPQASLF